jgi:hypothetical protein
MLAVPPPLREISLLAPGRLRPVEFVIPLVAPPDLSIVDVAPALGTVLVSFLPTVSFPVFPPGIPLRPGSTRGIVVVVGPRPALLLIGREVVKGRLAAGVEDGMAGARTGRTGMLGVATDRVTDVPVLSALLSAAMPMAGAAINNRLTMEFRSTTLVLGIEFMAISLFKW